MKHKFANKLMLTIMLLAGMALQAQVTYTDLYELDDPHGCCVTYPGLRPHLITWITTMSRTFVSLRASSLFAKL